ncbi:cupredoxin domain-containing protein [Noviherbaspirillum sp.]|uniref:cupredoxin domain-containing protein n=1 Tax=Noviherbaspirillum sp. TaxID=1926288 RepID=UPI002FE39773
MKTINLKGHRMTHHFTPNTLVAAAMALSLGLAAPLASAHSGNTHSKDKTATTISAEEKAFGKQGDPKKVTRTITVDMNDTMRFGPSDITVKQGETIRFVVKNSGKMMHEMVLGTMAELKEHGELMKKNPGMEHDEPYMTHVSPGKKEEMVWQFTKPGEFHYACLVAGHFEAGMIGKIKVAAK